MIVTGTIGADFSGQHYLTSFDGTWPILESAFEVLAHRCEAAGVPSEILQEPIGGRLAHGRVENGYVVELEVLVRRCRHSYRLPGGGYTLEGSVKA